MNKTIKFRTVGLHSQSINRIDGIISGSEITTLGLQDSFFHIYGIKPRIYGPENYTGLESDFLDLVIIEGWCTTVPKFIDAVKTVNPKCKILFWNLSFSGFENVLHLNVDGYITNSRITEQLLSKFKPTKFIMLAANHRYFYPMPADSLYSHNVVYLGMYNEKKLSTDVFDRIYTESSKFGLSIYGHSWKNHETLSTNWAGILPKNDISKLYNSAKIVLSTTELRQKAVGMINNRIFEAMSCGATIISEHFPELELVFGNNIFYSRKTGDTTKIVSGILDGTIERKDPASVGDFIIKNHTFDHRVEEMVEFCNQIDI